MTALLDLVQADVTLRRSSSRELAGPCPKCGGNDRFTVTPDAGSDGAGLWWCRGCNAGGDAVSYLREVRGLSYRDACVELDRNPGERKKPPRLREQRPAIEVKACPPPPDRWQALAEKLVAWAQTNVHTSAGERSRAYLAGRGLDADALRQHRIGYVPQNLFRDRAEWGLPEELREDGKPKTLFIPAGIVIPCLDGTGHVVRVRIRREAADDGPRYHTLAGSSSRCLVAGSGPAVVIVESDLDALLLGVVACDLVRAVSLGSAQSRPDEDAGAIVKAASVVLVSLDSDKAGARAAWSKWTSAPNATRWPIPPECGKDPGDAYRAGYDLRAWVEDGLHHSGSVTPSSTATALLEPSPASSSASIRTRETDLLIVSASATKRTATAIPPGPFPAVCAWLRALRLAPETERSTPRWAPERAIEMPPCPPYALALAALFERIGTGTADDSDHQRLAAWLPNGVYNARLVRDRNPAAGAALLAELGVVPCSGVSSRPV